MEREIIRSTRQRVLLWELLVLRLLYSAVVGSASSCIFEIGSDREDTSSDVCYVGDTR